MKGNTNNNNTINNGRNTNRNINPKHRKSFPWRKLWNLKAPHKIKHFI